MTQKSSISLYTEIDRNVFSDIVPFIEKGREEIFHRWGNNDVVCEIFQRLHIETGIFIQEFGMHLFDFFVDALKNNNKENYPDKIQHFTYLKNKNIRIGDFTHVCNGLKWSTLSYLENIIPSGENSRYVTNAIHCIFDENLSYILKRFSDILLHILEEYKSLTDHSSIVSITDPTGMIIYVNDEFCRTSEYTREELIGKQHNIVRHPDMSKEVFKNLWDTIQSKKMWQGIVKNKKKSGDSYWVKTAIIPFVDERGDIIEYIAIRTDITELEIAKEKLTESLKNLQELDEKKDEFINIASHELRTPMTAISGYISMILEGDAGEINDEVRLYLEQVFKSSKQLMTLINDMLDIAKLESGKGKLFYEDIEMRKFIEDVVGNLQPLARLKKQVLEYCIDYEELIYRTDNRQCQQVLVNIIGNALKYTPEKGNVTVRSWISDTVLFIRIEDTGIGIPEQYLEKIFEKFSQVKNPLTRDINGTGLGLAITKMIVEKFHGTIHVKSREGKGSAFEVQLPLQKE